MICIICDGFEFKNTQRTISETKEIPQTQSVET